MRKNNEITRSNDTFVIFVCNWNMDVKEVGSQWAAAQHNQTDDFWNILKDSMANARETALTDISR